MSLFCRFGWHAWSAWADHALSLYRLAVTTDDAHNVPGQLRTCARCNIREVRAIECGT